MGYTIKDAAALTGLSPYAIRFYEDSGLFIAKRNPQGNRVFEEEDLDWLKFLTCLKLTGMSIAQMRRIAELTREGDKTVPERLSLLKDHREELRGRMDALAAASDRLEHKIAYYTTMEKSLPGASKN